MRRARTLRRFGAGRLSARSHGLALSAIISSPHAPARIGWLTVIIEAPGDAARRRPSFVMRAVRRGDSLLSIISFGVFASGPHRARRPGASLLGARPSDRGNVAAIPRALSTWTIHFSYNTSSGCRRCPRRFGVSIQGNGR